MSTYYKATRPDGTDFRTGTVRYEVGTTVTHPDPGTLDASRYLSVATVPTDCTGMRWPCRLFEVTATDVWEDPDFPNKRCCHELTVVREVDAHLALGPQGREVAALVERAGSLTGAEVGEELAAAWYAAWGAARVAAWDAARAAAGDAARAAWVAAQDAARAAAWDAARAAAGDAAGDAAWALTLRDLIGTHGYTQEHYDLLTGPWRKTIGPIHPGDGDPS